MANETDPTTPEPTAAPSSPDAGAGVGAETSPESASEGNGSADPVSRRLFVRSSWKETRIVAEYLRAETVGGAVLLVAAVAALIWANSPWRDGYASLRDTVVGVEALHLNLSLGTWAADGLLAVFFLVAGIELKREFVAGDLSDRRRAALPIAAAVCGVVLPAVFFVVTVRLLGQGLSADELSAALRGWAVPTATDIAFALAVLAVISSHLPTGLRSFLLTLAVVDDLIAITIIAVFYTESVNLLLLLAAVIPLAAWRLLLQRGMLNPFLLAIPALLAWGLVHASGVHATVAGVLLGLLVPVSRELEESPDHHSLAERLEHHIRPFSAGFAVPVFAFFAAGVTVVGGGFGAALRDSVAIGVVVGLVVGKTVGVLGGTWLVSRFTRAELDDDLSWTDVLGLSLLSGVGFTVSLLIGELAFGSGSDRDDHVKVAVLVGSLIAAALAAVILRMRNKQYRLLEERERVDTDQDGIPDVYQAQ